MSLLAATWTSAIATVLPGADDQRPGLGTDFADGRRQIWIAFRDSAGIRWQATSDGQLTELQG